MFDDRKINVNSCINIFLTNAIIESIISSAFTNESGYSLSSIILHNVSMIFMVRRIKCALASYSKVSPYRHKQQESNYPLRDRSPLFKPMR